MSVGIDTFASPQALADAALPLAFNVLAALLVFFIGKWVAWQAVKLMKRAMDARGVEATLSGFIGNVVYGLALAVVVISALGYLGVNTTSAAALLGGAALAIGLALQSQLASFAAGVMLIIFRPFKVGDFVQAGGVMGTVEEISIPMTRLKSPDNQEVTVPNAQVWGSTITNFSAKPTRRVDLTVGISYGADLRKAKQILLDMLAAEERLLADPAPSVLVTNLGDSSVDFAVRGFTTTADWWATRCDLVERIKLTFDEQGIEIPFPQMDLHVRDMPKAA